MNTQLHCWFVRAAAGVALSLFWVPIASAEDEENYARKGGYMEWAASYAHFVGLEDAIQKSPGASSLEVTPGMGGDIAVGYRFTDRVGVDGQFTYVGIGDVEMNGRTVGQFEHYSLMLNSRAYLLTGRIQPYFIGGIGWQYAELDASLIPGGEDISSGVAFRIGGGADFYLNRNFALSASTTYLVGVGDVGDFDTLQARLGLLFRY